jgi:hypothetical protein
MHAYQAQDRRRMVTLHQDMQMVASFGQQSIPMVSPDSIRVMRKLVLSPVQKDQAGFPVFFSGPRG